MFDPQDNPQLKNLRSPPDRFAPQLSSRFARPERQRDTTEHLAQLRDSLIRRGRCVYEMQTSLITPPLRPTDHRKRGDYAEAYPPTQSGPPLGDPELRKAIARMRQPMFSDRIGPENIAITGGARQALHAVSVALANPYDEVILLPPCWNRYTEILQTLAVQPRMVPLQVKDQYQPDTRAVARAWGENTKAILATTPNNPTSTAISAQNLTALQQIARLNGGTLILDETFEAFNFSAEARESANLQLSNAALIGSFSETYSTPQLRIGYMVASRETLQHITRYEQILPSAPPLSVQKYHLELIANRQAHLDKVRPMIRSRQLALKTALLSNPLIETVFSEGGSFVWVAPKNVEAIDCRATVEQIAERTGVLLMPGDEYLAPGFFRIGVGQIQGGEAFSEACKRLEKFREFQCRARA